MENTEIDRDRLGDGTRDAAPDEDEDGNVIKPSPCDRYISDVIKVEIVPEKKGVFLKHTEYLIKSENHKSSVEHRYSDFLALNEHFLRVYEFRMVPRLPPKHVMLDAFLEERRAGLQRWLILVSQNQVLARDEIFKLFLMRNSEEFPPVPYTDDEFNKCSLAMQRGTFNSVEEVIIKREQVRKIMNQLLALKRLMTLQIKRRINQRKDYGELAQTLCSISRATLDTNLNDFSTNFLEIAKTTDSSIENGVTERLELLNEVLIAFSDLCDRVVYLKQMSLYDDKMYKGFSGSRLRNMIRSNLNNYEEESDRTEVQKKRVTFGICCAFEEFKLVQKYLKLLPSILLQFTYDESKTYTNISHILHTLLDTESDKLNS